MAGRVGLFVGEEVRIEQGEEAGSIVVMIDDPDLAEITIVELSHDQAREVVQGIVAVL